MKKYLAAIGVLFVFLLFSGSFYLLRADEQGVVLRLGKVVASRTEAGLYFKLPFLDQLTRYSKKLIEYDAELVAVVTSDKKNLVFDTFAIFTISDPELFYRRVRTVASVQQRLDDGRVDRVGRRGSRRADLDAVAREMGQVGRGHLRAAGVVDADEQDGRLVRHGVSDWSTEQRWGCLLYTSPSPRDT